jgi:hypothetical protein
MFVFLGGLWLHAFACGKHCPSRYEGWEVTAADGEIVLRGYTDCSGLGDVITVISAVLRIIVTRCSSTPSRWDGLSHLRLCVPHTIIITRRRNMTNDVREQTPPDLTALSTKPDDAAKNQAACDLTGVVVVPGCPRIA